MILGEIILFGAFETEDADNSPFPGQRYNQLGNGFRVDIQITRVLGDIAHAQRFVELGRGSNQSRARGQCKFSMLLFVGSDYELRLQQSIPLVGKEDRKDVVVDSGFDARCDLVDQFADLQRRSHIKTDFVQQGKKFSAFSLAFINPGILNRDCNLTGEQVQKTHLLVSKVTYLDALYIQNADNAILRNQWDRQFGTRALHSF